MSAVRPLVQVIQDFAAVSTPVSTADLNCLVVGPCYDVYSYPEDKDTAFNGKYARMPYLPAATAPDKGTISTAGLRAGAKIVPNSDDVLAPREQVLWVDSGFVEMKAAQAATNPTSAGSNVFTDTAADFITAGIQAGDRLVVALTGSDAKSGGSRVDVSVVSTVVSLTKTTLTLTDVFAADGTGFGKVPYFNASFTAALMYRIERPVSGVQATSFTSTVNSGNSSQLDITLVKVTVAGATRALTYGTIYLACRAFRGDLYTDIDTVTSVADINAKIGKIGALNPLALGVSLALANSGGKPIQFFGVGSNDIVGHQAAIDTIMGRQDVYAIVPLTQDTAIIGIWKAHCRTVADPLISKFRIVIGNCALPVSKQVWPAASVVATAESFTQDGPSGFYLVDNEGKFLDAGVAVKDVVTITKLPFVVDKVVANQKLRLLGTAPGAGTTYVIDRNFTKDQQITELAAVAKSFNDARCTMVWPDKCFVSGVDAAQPGYYVSCTVGGMVTGLPPHQGFTFLGVAGITRLLDSNTYFYDKHLTDLSNSGWFVMVQDSPQSLPYSIHELTTDVTSLETGELMVVKNFDFVSTTYRNAVLGYLGVWNVSKDTLDFLRSSLDAVSTQLAARRYPKIGAPLISGTVTSVTVPTNSKDQVDAYVSVVLPRPLNQIVLHLTA